MLNAQITFIPRIDLYHNDEYNYYEVHVDGQYVIRRYLRPTEAELLEYIERFDKGVTP